MSVNQAQNYNSFESGKNLPSGIGEAARSRQHIVTAAVYNGFLALTPMLPKPEAAPSPALPETEDYPVASTEAAATEPEVVETPEPTILDEDDSAARGDAARNVIDAIHAETMAGRVNGDQNLAA